MKYTGEKCVVCGEVFAEDSDIVVCPECGTPHHRSCWQKDNKCGNSPKHEYNYVWKAVKVHQEKINEEKDIVCPVCRFHNAVNSKSCTNCGVYLNDEKVTEIKNEDSEENPVQSYYIGFNPEEDMDGVSLKELSDFVRTNTIYYIPLFKRIKLTGIKFSFNLMCFIFPPFYFANRRMWNWALLSSFLMALFLIPLAVSYTVSQNIQGQADLITLAFAEFIYKYNSFVTVLIRSFNIADLLLRIFFCIFGNWIYYRYSVRTIKKIKKTYKNKSAEKVISITGGNSLVNIIIIAIIHSVIFIGTLFIISFLVRLWSDSVS